MDSEIDADGTKSTVGNQADNKYQNKTSQTCVLLPATWSLLSIATNVAFHREKVSLPQPVPGQTVNTISELASFRLAKPNLVIENRSGFSNSENASYPYHCASLEVGSSP